MICSDWYKYKAEKGDLLPSKTEIWIEKTDHSEPEETCDCAGLYKKYAKFYGIGEEDLDLSEFCTPFGKSRVPLEDKLFLLLKAKEWTENDVFSILAWKMGKIDHSASSDSEPAYVKGWNPSTYELQCPNGKYVNSEDFLKFAHKVIRWHSESFYMFKKPEDIWKEILDYVIEQKQNLDGLGTVYLITLFSFITCGEYPIYDRFAMASLASIYMMKENNIYVPKTSTIITQAPPIKKEAYGLLKEGSFYSQYCNLLKRYFNDWKERDVDRGLWVYGHSFNVSAV